MPKIVISAKFLGQYVFITYILKFYVTNMTTFQDQHTLMEGTFQVNDIDRFYLVIRQYYVRQGIGNACSDSKV